MINATQLSMHAEVYVQQEHCLGGRKYINAGIQECFYKIGGSLACTTKITKL